jgi:CDGSH-type Zn-finger protein
VAGAVLALLQKETSFIPEQLAQRSEAYFRSLPPDELKRSLYAGLTEFSKPVPIFVLRLLGQLDLLDYDVAEELLNSKNLASKKVGLKLLRLNKANYTSEDVYKIEKLREQVLSAFAKRGKEIEVDKLLSSKKKQKWLCECGKSVNTESVCCPSCFHDIYGFTSGELKAKTVADLLARKANALAREFGAVSRSVEDIPVLTPDHELD